LKTSPFKNDGVLLTVLSQTLTSERERERGRGERKGEREKQKNKKTEVSCFMMLTIVKII